MGDSNIEWTDKTWNPWSGCQKVSQGCKNCYAAVLPPSMRRRAEWGADTPRIEASEEYWREPITWDRKAAKEGVRRKVFCASTADIGEARPELDAWRDRALALVALTPNLDWLWLTKRPEYLAEYFAAPDLYRRVLDAANFFRSTPGRNGMRRANDRCGIAISDPTHELPRNLWVGTSVEDQAATTRIDTLRRIPARVRFLSMEPLLGPIQADLTGIQWVIVGGESGRSARPMHPDWARSIREQCVSAGVPFFFKQWGEWIPRSHTDRRHDWHAERTPDANGWRVPLPDGCRRVALAHDGSLSEATVWNGHDDDGPGSESYMHRVGKDATGRMLDGREWSEFPAEPQQPALFGATP